MTLVTLTALWARSACCRVALRPGRWRDLGDGHRNRCEGDGRDRSASGLGRVGAGAALEGGAQLKQLEPTVFYATTGFPLKKSGEVPIYTAYLESEKIVSLANLSEDLMLTARNALLEMIDCMVKTKGLTPEQAYVVASVAVDLHIGQVVDVPNYIVSAILPLDIFTTKP